MDPVAPSGVTDFPDREGDMNEDDLTMCMARLAEGDRAFFFTLHDRFGEKVAWVVRDILREMGRHDVLADADEVAGLTLDACEVIMERAGGWRPGGAAPWTWARLAIRSRVAVAVGHRTVEFDDTDVDGEAGDHPGGVVVDLTGDDLAVLIERHPAVRLLDAAIRAVGSERDQRIYWEYRIQQGLGDPSPARTVGPRFGVQPDNVRQISRRHGTKVWTLVQTDDRFTELRDHGWFAA